METVLALEKALGEWAGVKDVVVCSSGTAALHLSLEALQLPQGSLCIVPDYTMIACARAVTLAGLKPVFCDVTPDTLLMDPDEVDRICSERGGEVRAIIPVHIYGRRCDMDGLHMLAQKYGLRVVEDLAEAHGVNPHPQTDAACWSFFRNKIVAGEEGGAVAFPKQHPVTIYGGKSHSLGSYRADHARSLRCLGFTESHDYSHIARGMNYRLADSLARLIHRSLDRYQLNADARRGLEVAYNQLCPLEWRQPPRDAVWVYDVRIPGLSRKRMGGIVKALQAESIQARYGFLPMSQQEEYWGKGGQRRNPNAEGTAEEVFYLPVDPGLTSPTRVKVAFEVIKGVLGI